jgi:hypothetical protein
VWRGVNFMNLLLLKEGNSELFIMCIIIELQEKMQYFVGSKNSKKEVHWFCDQRNIEFSLGV